MNLDLRFSPPTEVTLPTGKYLLREADPTDRFWAAYKRQTFEQLQAHGVSLVQRSKGRWVVQIHEPLEGAKPAPQPVYQLKDTRNLFDWQIPHAGHLVAVLDRHGAVLDASDTGTGKTYVAVSVARERRLKPLVIAPKVGMRKWADVCKLLGVPFRCVVGWEEAKTKGFPYTTLVWNLIPEDYKDEKTGQWKRRMRKELQSLRWKTTREDLLIFDEAHRAKGFITQNARLLAASRGTPTLALSATAADGPRDMWALGIRLGLHNGGNFKEFCESLLCFKDKTKGWSMVDRQLSAMKLHKLIFPEHGGRIRIKDLGSAFPDNFVTPELVEIEEPSKLNDLYKSLLLRVAQLEEQGRNMEVIVERLRYRQATELHKLAAMIELAENDIEEGNGVAMFVGFRETLDHIAKHFGKRCAVIHGDQTIDAREKQRLLFENNEVDCIVSMIQAGGISCDMHDINGKPRTSIISPCDNATQVKQVLGRIHRAGGKSAARQRILYAAGTVEERVYANAASKILAIDTINDGDLLEPELIHRGPAFRDEGGDSDGT